LPETIDWLLEPTNPSVRALTLTGLLGRPADDPEVMAARAAIPTCKPARAILDAQWPEGYWMHPGIGYSPKYKATVWQVIFLAQLGAPRTPAIDRACTYVLDHARSPNGLFTAGKTAREVVICLNGNLLRAIRQLDQVDPRLEESIEALAQEIVRDEFRCCYNARPHAATHHGGLPCAWGAVKVLGALAELPVERRSPAVHAAVEAGIAFLLSGGLAARGYPTSGQPSPLWRKLSFPLGYSVDLLEGLEVLLRLAPESGIPRSWTPRLQPAIDAVLSKQDNDGRWQLEHALHNTWASFGPAGQPNKWVTLRALRVLRALRAWEANKPCD
jgi:hypothetical protein